MSARISNWLCVTVARDTSPTVPRESVGTVSHDSIQTLPHDTLGLAAKRVREIAVIEEATRTPGAPSWVIGAANLRGSILPLVDLGALLGISAPRGAAAMPSSHAPVIVAIWEGELDGLPSTVGLVVESVSDLLEVPEAEIERAPEFGTDVPAEILLGLARSGDHFALLVDIERALRRSR